MIEGLGVVESFLVFQIVGEIFEENLEEFTENLEFVLGFKGEEGFVQYREEEKLKLSEVESLFEK